MAASSSKRLLPPGSSVDAVTLMTMVFEESRAILPGLIYVGLTILASRPKDGKSFLVLKLGLCLAAGMSFLGFPAVACGVLILALEDTLDRLKDRLELISCPKTERLHLATSSKGLPDAIFRELDAQLSAYPDIKVVVVDTLQKVRHRDGDVGYNGDYADLGALKEFADSRGIAILLVHHTRKAEAATEYDRISGTSGITGVADTVMVLTRSDDEATLRVKGREFEESVYRLAFNGGDWDVVSEEALRRKREETLPEGVRLTLKLMAACDGWSGTFKELLETIKCPETTERALSQQLRDNEPILAEHGIDLSSKRTSKGTVVSLTKNGN